MLPAHPVAAAEPLRALLTGPPRPARVLLTGRLAAYLSLAPTPRDLGAPPACGGAIPRDHAIPRDLADPRVLAVVAHGALRPPCALVLPRGLVPSDVLVAGREVTLGQGGLHSCTVMLEVRRWWAPPPLPSGPPEPAAVARARHLLAISTDPGPADGQRASALAAAAPAAAALAAGDVDAAAAALLAVLGLGPGSTPSGDDVAAGVLLGARAAGAAPGDVDRLGAVLVAAAEHRTTAVSAGLLAEAAAGRALAPVVGLLQALLARADVDTALGELLRLGHTSGADLATGVTAAAASLARPWRRSA